MKINIAVYYEFSKKCSDTLLIESEKASDPLLSVHRLLRDAPETLKQNILWICSAEEYLSLPPDTEGCCFAVSGNISKKEIHKRNHRVLLFLQKPPLSILENLLDQIQEQYSQWKEMVMEKIYSGKNLQDIFDLAVSVLSFPVALFDKHSILLAKAGLISENITGSVWEDVLANQYFPNDEVPISLNRKIYEEMILNKQPVLYYSKKHEEYQVTCGLFLRNQFFGLIGAASKRIFSRGELSLYWDVKKMLEWALIQNVQIAGVSDDVPYFVERMLSGYHMDENVVAFQLRLLNWQMEDHYITICLRPADNGILYENDSLRFIGHLRESFPISLCFYYENSIVCIIRTLGKAYKNQTSFSRFLNKNGLRAGISMQFENFMHLEYAYIQCKHALQYSVKNICEFSEIYNRCIIETLGNATSLKSLCHPILLNYWQKGAKKEYEYIYCMKVFLQNGRNITDAAQKLSLHRNTLIYRINYMGKLLNIDLKSGYLDDSFISLLMTSCNIIEFLSDCI